MLQRPAYLKPVNPALTAKLAAGLGSNQPPTISRKANRFTLIGANGEPHKAIPPSLTLDVVIVGGNANASKMFFEGDYVEGEATAPTCFSDNGVAPSTSAAKPQSETCANCPQNVWGSKISNMGSKIQACSTLKKVAVIVGGDQTATVWLLTVPPASLKPWRGYMAHLGGQGIDPSEIVTRIGFGDQMGLLTFDPVDFIPENWVEPIARIVASDEPDVVSGMKDQPRIGALPASQERAQISARPEDRREQVEAPAHTTFAGSAPAQQERVVPQDRTPTLEELQAEIARLKAQPAPEPLKRTRKPKEETVVGPGPIPPTTFASPAQPAPQSNGFIGGGAPAAQGFGVTMQAPPASSAIEDMLSKAFQLPVRK